jgi:hypothetical protein
MAALDRLGLQWYDVLDPLGEREVLTKYITLSGIVSTKSSGLLR